MRELKFRIWNEKHKEFFFWGFVGSDSVFSGIPTGSGITLDYAKENSEQFTGLHDKNDKEIYEGGVVVCTYGKYYLEKDGLTRIGKIIYDDRTASFKMNVKDSAVSVGFYDINKIEIIGNIHENPELLK